MGSEYNVNQAAAVLDTNPRTVRRHIERKWIKARLVDKSYKIKEEAVARFKSKMAARSLLGNAIEEIYVLRRHNTHYSKFSDVTMECPSTIDLAVERYEEERMLHFQALGITRAKPYLLGKEVAARLKIADYHVINRMINEGYIKARQIQTGTQFKNVIQDKSFREYLGKDLNNPFYNSKYIANLLGVTVYKIDRTAKNNGLGRKIVQTDNSHYLFIYEDLLTFTQILKK